MIQAPHLKENKFDKNMKCKMADETNIRTHMYKSASLDFLVLGLLDSEVKPGAREEPITKLHELTENTSPHHCM